MAAKDFANTRFSGLQEITADNVASLKPVWMFATGVLRGHEAAPLVVNGTMFVVTPYPNFLYALDLTQGFFTRLLEKNDLATADRTRGRFRSWLLGCMKHYLANEHDRATAQKRGGGRKKTTVIRPGSLLVSSKSSGTRHSASTRPIRIHESGRAACSVVIRRR